jgi:uncharacterized protein
MTMRTTIWESVSAAKRPQPHRSAAFRPLQAAYLRAASSFSTTPLSRALKRHKDRAPLLEIPLIWVICVSFATLFLAGTSFAADPNPKLKVLLITGGHGFEEPQFFKVFKDNPEITVTFAAHGPTNADAYDRDDLAKFDVVVLYDMRKTITDGQKAKLMSLFDKGTGLVVLHHALVSYQHWPEYEKIIGGKYPEADGKAGVVTEEAGYKHDEEVPVVIVAKDHPVTAGLQDFTIHDEIYWGFHTQPDAIPLITTTHPKSGKPLAWCRTQGKSRVIYLQLGHDHQAYENPNYQKLVANSIRWTANK